MWLARSPYRHEIHLRRRRQRKLLDLEPQDKAAVVIPRRPTRRERYCSLQTDLLVRGNKLEPTVAFCICFYANDGPISLAT
jgi:hypothetical protein